MTKYLGLLGLLATLVIGLLLQAAGSTAGGVLAVVALLAIAPYSWHVRKLSYRDQ